MPLEAYLVQSHTRTLPRSTFKGGLQRATPLGALFCAECIESDLGSSGMSFWRRSHYLPGAVNCDSHRRPLSQVDIWPKRPSVVATIEEVLEALAKLKPRGEKKSASPDGPQPTDTVGSIMRSELVVGCGDDRRSRVEIPRASWPRVCPSRKRYPEGGQVKQRCW